MKYTSDKTFDKTDFSQLPLDKGEYENCVFEQYMGGVAEIVDLLANYKLHALTLQ